MTIHKRFVSAALARAGRGLVVVIAAAGLLLVAGPLAGQEQDGQDNKPVAVKPAKDAKHAAGGKGNRVRPVGTQPAQGQDNPPLDVARDNPQSAIRNPQWRPRSHTTTSISRQRVVSARKSGRCGGARALDVSCRHD